MPFRIASQAQIASPAFVFDFPAGKQNTSDKRIGSGVAIGSSGLQFSGPDDCHVKDVSPAVVAGK